jgi:hypothetical protein
MSRKRGGVSEFTAPPAIQNYHNAHTLSTAANTASQLDVENIQNYPSSGVAHI